jgi:hypothetical protein
VEPATGQGFTSTSGSLSGTGDAGRRPGQQGILPIKALSQTAARHKERAHAADHKERARAADVLAGQTPSGAGRPHRSGVSGPARPAVPSELRQEPGEMAVRS